MREEPSVQDQQRHLVVAGNGMVGQRLVEAVRDRDTRRTWRVTVLSEEPRRAYDRVALSSYFDGAAPADLDVVAEGCYDTAGYTLRLDEAVTAVDRGARTVTTSRGDVLGYDALVLATGSYPFVPPVVVREIKNQVAVIAATMPATGRVSAPPAPSETTATRSVHQSGKS